MAHCSSCGDAGNHHLASPPDRATPECGQRSIPHQLRLAHHGRARVRGVPRSLHPPLLSLGGGTPKGEKSGGGIDLDRKPGDLFLFVKASGKTYTIMHLSILDLGCPQSLDLYMPLTQSVMYLPHGCEQSCRNLLASSVAPCEQLRESQGTVV